MLLGIAVFCLIKPGLLTAALGLLLLVALVASREFLGLAEPTIEAEGAAEARGPAVPLDAALMK